MFILRKRGAQSFLVLAFLLSAFVGCTSKRVEIENRTITKVVGVFFHENGRWTLMVEEGKKLVLITYGKSWPADVEIFGDVPESDEMWAYARTTSGNGYDSSILRIHIHSVRDINGAGWNHGKFGSGTTVRIVPPR